MAKRKIAQKNPQGDYIQLELFLFFLIRHFTGEIDVIC